MEVFYFSNSNIHCVVHWQAQVNQKIFVGHTTQLHEWYGVTVVEAAFVLIRLQKHGLLQVNKQRYYYMYYMVFACIQCRFTLGTANMHLRGLCSTE